MKPTLDYNLKRNARNSGFAGTVNSARSLRSYAGYKREYSTPVQRAFPRTIVGSLEDLAADQRYWQTQKPYKEREMSLTKLTCKFFSKIRRILIANVKHGPSTNNNLLMIRGLFNILFTKLKRLRSLPYKNYANTMRFKVNRVQAYYSAELAPAARTFIAALSIGFIIAMQAPVILAVFYIQQEIERTATQAKIMPAFDF